MLSMLEILMMSKSNNTAPKKRAPKKAKAALTAKKDPSLLAENIAVVKKDLALVGKLKDYVTRAIIYIKSKIGLV